MADLLPSLASDDERPLPNNVDSDDEDDEEASDDDNEVDKTFQFGGILVSCVRCVSFCWAAVGRRSCVVRAMKRNKSHGLSFSFDYSLLLLLLLGRRWRFGTRTNR